MADDEIPDSEPEPAPSGSEASAASGFRDFWADTDFGDMSANELDADVDLDEPDWEMFFPDDRSVVQEDDTPVDEVQRAREEHAKQIAAQATQNTGWRRTLFWTVYWIVLAFATVSCVGIVIYMAVLREEASPVVLSTWAGGSVAQVVGLMLVITKHLFPSSHDEMPSS